MFKFLKEKLKSAISKISEGVEKEGKAEEKIVETPAEERLKEEKGFFAKLKEKFAGKEKEAEEKQEAAKLVEEKTEVRKEEKPAVKEELKKEKPQIPQEKKKEKEEAEIKRGYPKDQIEKEEKKEDEIKKAYPKEVLVNKEERKHVSEFKEIQKKHEHKDSAAHKIQKPEEKTKLKEEPEITKAPEKKGFFESIKEKIITTKINAGQFEGLFWEMELALMENNVAMEVIGKIKKDLEDQLVEKPIKRTKVEETIRETLKHSISGLFEAGRINLLEEIGKKKEKPYVIAFFGINGSGKTTSIAKVANMLKQNNISCVLAASDTFRAASIEQLQMHADKIGVKLIKHAYGSDPAAIAFDAIKHAKAKNIDTVLIDTAGRMHSNSNLIEEMKKIIRVAKPDLKIFVGESITGNDCVEQAKTFNEAVGIDGIILAKADIDEKGGAAISVSYVTQKPILYFGTGQSYNDLEPFTQEKIMKNIGLV